MMSNDEFNKITQSLPSDLNPTLTYSPDIKSTISINTMAKGMSEDSIQYFLPKLSINNDGSNETQINNDLHVEYTIGKGGLGQVDAAQQLCFGRRVAIKRVRPDRGNAFAEEQLRREAQLMGALEHPAIPPVHLVGYDDDDQVTLVMKFIEGCSWLEIINRDFKKVPPHKLPQWYIEKHLNYFLRIGEALEFAHQKSIIHRDIKPENVVVGSYGEVYLIDWGIASRLDKNRALRDHGYAGTPCYASPEMVVTKPVWDIRSDVYLMGATLFHIFSGRAPHRGDSLSDVFTKILNEPTPKLSNSIHSGLRDICSRAMSQYPDERYTSVHGMLEDIRHFLSHGELSELYSHACEDFARLKELSKSKIVSDEIEAIGSKCRYKLEQINQSWPENNAVKEKLCQCIMILTDDAVHRKRLAAARALLKQYSDLIGKQTNQWIQDTNNRIKQVAEQLVSRSDELGTGIQVILVEELAAQKKAYEDLLAAYVDMKNSKK